MSPRRAAYLLALGRVVVGSGLALAPGIAGRLWIRGEAARPASRLLLRALGARDLVIGAGTALALARGEPARRWLLGGMAADFADFAATIEAGDDIHPLDRTVVMAVAGGSALSGALFAASID